MQQSFDFQFPEASLQESDFVLSSSNSNAFALINNWQNWDSHIFLLYGPKASGKTHLASIWQNHANANYIGNAEIYQGNYDTTNNYILEDIEHVHDEPALFHFYNSMKEAQQGYLLMTASAHPTNLGIRLPDLRSRLNSVPSASLSNPDEELMRTMFVKQFADRQLRVDMDVINYLVSRIDRSFNTLNQLVDTLDKQALKERKNITIPFAKQYLP